MTTAASGGPPQETERKVHQDPKHNAGLLPRGEDVLSEEEEHQDPKEEPEDQPVHGVRVDGPIRIWCERKKKKNEECELLRKENGEN